MGLIPARFLILLFSVMSPKADEAPLFFLKKWMPSWAAWGETSFTLWNDLSQFFYNMVARCLDGADLERNFDFLRSSRHGRLRFRRPTRFAGTTPPRNFIYGHESANLWRRFKSRLHLSLSLTLSLSLSLSHSHLHYLSHSLFSISISLTLKLSFSIPLLFLSILYHTIISPLSPSPLR